MNQKHTHMSSHLGGDNFSILVLREDLMQMKVPLDDPSGLMDEEVPILPTEEAVGVVLGLAVLTYLSLLHLIPLDGLLEGTAPDPGAFQEEGLVVPHGDGRNAFLIHLALDVWTWTLTSSRIWNVGERVEARQDGVEQIVPGHAMLEEVRLLEGTHLLSEIVEDLLVVPVELGHRRRTREFGYAGRTLAGTTAAVGGGVGFIVT